MPGGKGAWNTSPPETTPRRLDKRHKPPKHLDGDGAIYRELTLAAEVEGGARSVAAARAYTVRICTADAEGPSLAYSLPVHSCHTRRDRVAPFD